jgi:maltose O-acetyltransferase
MSRRDYSPQHEANGHEAIDNGVRWVVRFSGGWQATCTERIYIMATPIGLKRQQPCHGALWQRVARAAGEEFGLLGSRRVLAQLAAGLPSQAFSRSRTALLRRSGMQIGAGSLIQGALHVTGADNWLDNPCRHISIGDFTMISGNLHCDVGAPIRIGNRVRIGHGVTLLTVDHQVGAEDMRSGKRKFGPIEIGDGAWLASCVLVLPGVVIGAGAIVAAGSVVTRDVPANTLVLGTPARVSRNLNADADLDLENTATPASSRRFLRQV